MNFPKGSSFLRSTSFLAVLIGSCLLLTLRPFTARATANWGWLLLSQSQSAELENLSTASLAQAHKWFEISDRIQRTASSSDGLAQVSVRQLLPYALESWETSNLTNEAALYFAQQAALSGEFSQAVTWAYVGYRSGDLDSSLNQSRFAVILGQNCQKLAATLPQKPNVVQDACEMAKRYWGNLIVNGGFNVDAAGWSSSRQHNSKNEYYIGHKPQCTGQCLCIRGEEDSYHGGWFQTLVLPANREITLHADIVIIEDQSLNLKALSLEYRNDLTVSAKSKILEHGELSPGTHSISLDLITPIADGQSFRFYPLLLSGIGEVCVDNVTLDFQS